MKLKLLITIICVNTLVSYSQQIGNGYATHLMDFTTPLFSGAYGGPHAVGKAPDNSHDWQHLFVIRHANPENNFQLQLASTYSENDKLFFRKIDNSANSTWYELATRGVNTFTGNQVINGRVGIGRTPEDFLVLDVNGKIFARSLLYVNDIMGGDGGDIRIGPNTANPSSTIFMVGGANAYEVMRVNHNGNVGIGTGNPTSKLTVAGNIASREVKVTVDAGADFVFEKEYNLPSLESVDQFIKKNKHLPEVASAEEMKKEGINLSEMNIKLLQKIEELTLYVIEQNKRIEKVEKENTDLKSNQLELQKMIKNQSK